MFVEAPHVVEVDNVLTCIQLFLKGTSCGRDGLLDTIWRYLVSKIAMKGDVIFNLVMLTVDFSNAFNMIDRSTLLQEVRVECPSISLWVEFLYCSVRHRGCTLGMDILWQPLECNKAERLDSDSNPRSDNYGVCYAKKDYNLAKHPDIDVPNLQVIKLMQSFKSREYVRETFAWMHYYSFLTNDGIEFLRTYLNLPYEIVPATLKKQAKPTGARPFGGDSPRGPPRFEGERRFGGDRDGYRGGPRGPGGEFGGEKGGAPTDYRPSFGIQ
ncbi:40S ribosomal protein s10-like [Trifolium pratense]|uniref:40S ribosomal protein s10-like n=1 Tax=Trifolium pratense TaxID=57577 RepID=A0A2K3N5U6_TRIPR|nr:40S ribosomal protein s10-like [Trifolium pratense]